MAEFNPTGRVFTTAEMVAHTQPSPHECPECGDETDDGLLCETCFAEQDGPYEEEET